MELQSAPRAHHGLVAVIVGFAGVLAMNAVRRFFRYRHRRQ